MTNTFDFFNYNYSSLISVFAAMIGMAYPLILQTIQQVDDKYHSTLLARYVRNRMQFKVFNLLLLISVIVSFLAPYLVANCLSDVKTAIALECLHTIVILSLVFSVILLFRFILITASPKEFLEHVKANNSPKSPLLEEVFQFAKYGSQNESAQLFFDAMDYIAECYKNNLLSEHKNAKVERSFEGVIYELRNILTKDEDNYFKTYEQLVSIYFDDRTPNRIDSNAFVQIWTILDIILYKQQNAYFLKYWERASMYYDTITSCNDKDSLSVKKKFIEQHFMLLVSLVFRDRIDVLSQISNSVKDVTLLTPLVPSTVQEICDVIVSVLDKHKVNSCQISSEYPIREINDYVNRDVITVDSTMTLSAMLIVRLAYVSYRNPNRADIYSLDFIDKATPDDLRQILFACTEIATKLESLYNETNVQKLRQLVPITDTKQSQQNLVNKIRYRCISKLSLTALQNGTSQQKKDRIINILCTYLKTVDALPLTTELAKVPQEQKVASTNTITCTQHLDSLMLQDGCPNELPESEIKRNATYIVRQLFNHYSNVFRNESPRAKYHIFKSELPTALTRLGIDSRHCLLMVGMDKTSVSALLSVSPSFKDSNGQFCYNGAKVYFIPVNEEGVIITESKTTPYYEVIDSAPIDQFSLSDAECKIYSNIAVLDHKATDNTPLKIMRTYRITQPDGFIRYYRLSFINNPSSPSQIGAIQSLV